MLHKTAILFGEGGFFFSQRDLAIYLGFTLAQTLVGLGTWGAGANVIRRVMLFDGRIEEGGLSEYCFEFMSCRLLAQFWVSSAGFDFGKLLVDMLVVYVGQVVVFLHLLDFDVY